jgi:hypothetical protein
VRPLAPPGLADSEDEREGIGENFCQPPLLLPLPRAVVELAELPGLDADPEFELARVSDLWPERWNPLFELVFPGLATFPVDLPFDAAAVLPRAEKKC